MKSGQVLLRLAGLLASLMPVAPGLQAQELKLMHSRSVYLRYSNTEQGAGSSAEPYLDFENINKIPYYTDKDSRNRIQDLTQEAATNYPELQQEMLDYVLKFGIQNFGQQYDLDLIWQLGQLHELQQDTTTALLLYSIALNNHSQHYPQVRKYYEALYAPAHSEWVDLDYYYRVVEARRKIDTLIPPRKVLLRLDSTINAVNKPDYAPYMHPYGDVLIYTSRRSELDLVAGPDAQPAEDLYYSLPDPVTGKWTPSERFSDNINSAYNEGSACLNQEGIQLIFSRCNAPDGLGLCDLYISSWKNGTWTQAVNLGPNVNSPDWDSHPCLSPDGRILYFVSNRGGGFGRTDIWMCRRNKDGSFQPAENLGPVVNTIEDEVTPFLHPINETLYFSSTGHLHGNGGFDIYKTRQANRQWEQPRNLGPLVNGPQDEYYFSIDRKGENLFYARSSEQNARDFDIYSFPMPMEARPDAVYKLKGYLIDSLTQKPINGIVVAIDLDKGVEIAPVHINSTGYFEFNLVNNRQYQLLILGENAFRIEDQSGLSQDSVFAILEQSILHLKPVVFGQLTFAADDAGINPVVKEKLAPLVEFLKRHPGSRLEIRGHTDSDGKPGYNLKLSRERAQNIKTYLTEQTGMPDLKIAAQGYGDTRPVFPNDSPAHKARNRRVEFEIFLPEAERQNILRRHQPPVQLSLNPQALDTLPDDQLRKYEEEILNEGLDDLEAQLEAQTEDPLPVPDEPAFRFMKPELEAPRETEPNEK